MPLFTRSLNRFAESPSDGPLIPNEQNITQRKKLSAVSTSLNGNDGLVAESPRNLYSRQNVTYTRRKVHDETDGATMSISGQTPVEQRAAEIRRMNSQKKGASMKREENHAPQPIQYESSSSSTATSSKPDSNQKKSRTSTSSLASVLRSRASSPIERMRKFIGRSTSKQPKEISAPSSITAPRDLVTNELALIEELEKVRNQLAQAQLQLAEQNKKFKNVQMVSCSQQYDSIPGTNVGTMTEMPMKTTDGVKKEIRSDKENMHPDFICTQDNEVNLSRIQSLKQEVAALKKENADQKEDFRRTRKDFILILKEAVLRKDEAESKLEITSKCISDEDDWVTLMSQHRHALRRNVLLMWVQKKLEPYSDEFTVSNFSSDWTDCRAFCALLYDLFPETMHDVGVSPTFGECVGRCRRTFQLLEIPFDERSLGIATSPMTDSGADDSSSVSSVVTGLPDWRYIMNTVFVIYKRGVLGKK